MADQQDISTVDIENVIVGDVDFLADLAARYSAGDTLVSYLRFGLEEKSGNRRLEISNVRYSLLQEPVTDLITLVAKSGEDNEAVILRGAETVIHKLEEEWKSENLLSHNGQGVASFTVPISGLKDWLDIKRRIREVSVVRRMELLLISLDEVRLNLHYVGALEQLRTALRQADLTLIREDNEWVIYSLGAVLPDRL